MSDNSGIVLLVTGFICFLVAWVGFVWMLSASSLAAAECEHEFSLFHEQWICRQPRIAIVVWATSGCLCLWSTVKGLKTLNRWQSDDKKEPDDNPV